MLYVKILTPCPLILCCIASDGLLLANMRKMGNVESGLERLKWDKQITFCSLWEHGMCLGDISQAGRKLSPAALEQCYSSPGVVLQSLRNVSPRPLEKVYSPLRKSCKRCNVVTVRPLRRQSCSPGKSSCFQKGGRREGRDGAVSRLQKIWNLWKAEAFQPSEGRKKPLFSPCWGIFRANCGRNSES